MGDLFDLYFTLPMSQGPERLVLAYSQHGAQNLAPCRPLVFEHKCPLKANTAHLLIIPKASRGVFYCNGVQFIVAHFGVI